MARSLARSDISDLLGASFGNSGFSAVVPAGALKNAQAMAANAKLFVYIHTPGKGTWYQTTTITLVASLPFPTT